MNTLLGSAVVSLLLATAADQTQAPRGPMTAPPDRLAALFAGMNPGSQEVARAMRLDPQGETLTGDITYRLLDASDQVVAVGCAKEIGMRFTE